MKASVTEAFADLRALKESALARPLPAAFAEDPYRFVKFQARLDDLLFDFSKQIVFDDTLDALVKLAEASEVEAKREAMFSGAVVNPTERRAALHTALRDVSLKPVLVDGRDVAPDIANERAKMLAFAADVREGRARGALGAGGPAASTHGIDS